jgi:hypothetical protein
VPEWTRAGEATVFCPSCGAEYRAGVPYCSECRVALVRERPDELTATPVDPSSAGYVPIGAWPRLSVQILRSRLENAGISVMVEWSGTGTDGIGTLVVPIEQSEFAAAVVHEIDVDDEVPDTSPHAYVVRLEEHLAAAAELLQELRTRLDELEAERQS